MDERTILAIIMFAMAFIALPGGIMWIILGIDRNKKIKQ